MHRLIKYRYLEDTNHSGNVAIGWASFIDSKPRAHNPFMKREKRKASERVFSYSSTTSPIPREDIERELMSFMRAPSPSKKKSKAVNRISNKSSTSNSKKKKKRRTVESSDDFIPVN